MASKQCDHGKAGGELRGGSLQEHRGAHDLLHRVDAIGRLVGVERAHLDLDRPGETGRWPGRTDHQSQQLGGRLMQGNIEVRVGLPRQVRVLHVTDHTDDLTPRPIPCARPDALAERRAVKQLLGERLVDHDDRGGRVLIAGLESPAPKQRNPHGVKVAVAHDPVVGPSGFPGHGGWLSVDGDCRRAVVRAQRERIDNPGGVDTRQRVEPVE